MTLSENGEEVIKKAGIVHSFADASRVPGYDIVVPAREFTDGRSERQDSVDTRGARATCVTVSCEYRLVLEQYRTWVGEQSTLARYVWGCVFDYS